MLNRVRKLFSAGAAVKRAKDEHLQNWQNIRRRIETIAVIAREKYVKELLSDRRYDDSKRLENMASKYSRNTTKTALFRRFLIGSGL
jgi:predicted P-loop ATPase